MNIAIASCAQIMVPREVDPEAVEELIGFWKNAAEPPLKCVGRHGHTTVWTDRWMIIHGGHGDSGPLNSTCAYDFVNNDWMMVSESPLKGRFGHTAVWTETQMIIFGGEDEVDNFFDDGALLTFNSDGSHSWSGPISTIGTPSPRSSHICEWNPLANEMVCWGGFDAQSPSEGPSLSSSARYSPETDEWRAAWPTETGLLDYCAVSAGAKLLVWDFKGQKGYSYDYSGNGTWDAMCNEAQCNASVPESRTQAACAWTGEELVVWGGNSLQPGHPTLNTGGRYHPETKSWISITPPPPDILEARREHQAVWVSCSPCFENGAVAFLGGDQPGLPPMQGGALYDPYLDSLDQLAWTKISSIGSPVGEAGFSLISTGNGVVMGFGHGQEAGVLRSVGLYLPCGYGNDPE